jgi:pimeloyl-ACP methyl ester carboxylesterase
MSTHIVLVPGYWLGGWAWDEVAPRLRDRGHRVTAVTLPGLESPDADRSGITLAHHADAIAAAVRSQPAERTLLVAHSGGAVPATVATDRDPRLVDHVVYVDSGPAVDGLALMPDLEGDDLPLPPWEQLTAMGNSLEGLDEDDLDRFRQRAVPQPAETAREAVRLADPERFRVPGTLVCCSLRAADLPALAARGVPFLAALGDHDLRYVDLPTGHWPMWSRPVELAALLDEVARSLG